MSGSSLFYGGVAVIGLVLVGSQLRTAEPAVAPGLPPAAAAPAVPAPAPASGQALNAFGAVTLARAPDSHFYADAQVNGASVRFLVDTGATSVVLTGEDARRAGIGGGDYTALGTGAGGQIRLMPVQVGRLSLGPVALDNVAVLVAEDGKLQVSLLGQSFLQRAGTVTIEGDRLTLR
ncbi:MAG TPA: TIGR02281 family clan AA aspartic protease [Allosphingosinicella sp.]